MLIGFMWQEEEEKRPDGTVLKKATVGQFDDIPERLGDGVRVMRAETATRSELIAPAPKVVAGDAGELPCTRSIKRPRRTKTRS